MRRTTLTANRVIPKASAVVQCNFWDDPAGEKREHALQQAFVAVRKRYGKNALFRGMDLLENARTLTRNEEIGGHRA